MTGLTLFAGAGGADIGLRAAAVTHLACVEVDADACATLAAAGFPAVRAGIGGDYTTERGEVVRWFDPLPFVGVDLVWASPPCQPYSRAGKGLGAADPRDGWPATVAVLMAVRPRWVAIENVGGAPVAEWSAELAALGYVVSAATLNCADYGVPQTRVREFIVAGPRVIEWPRRTHYGPRLPPLLRGGLLSWVGMGEALSALPGADGEGWRAGLRAFRGGANPRYSGGVRTERDLTGEPSTTIACAWATNQAPVVCVVSGGLDRPHTPSAVSVGEPCPTLTGVGNTRAASEPQRLERPSLTVTTCEAKGTRGDHMWGTTRSGAKRGGPDRASDAAYLATGRRRLSVAECALLQDFPLGYPFQGTQTARYRQVGNAVPSRMARLIVEAMR